MAKHPMRRRSRWAESLPAMPRLRTVGPLGVTVRQDEERPGIDRANGLCRLGKVRPDAVFIGDSLTAGWQVAPLLADLLPVIVNRGIGGDSARWLVHRIRADVVQLRPRICVLMIGTNDISHRFGYDSNDTIVRDYARHMQQILARLIRARIRTFVGTIPPVRLTLIDDVHNRRKQQCIPRMNAVLRRLVRRDARRGLRLVDYYPHFLDEDRRSLRPDLSTDACHLNCRGQYLMCLVLREALETVLQGDC